MAGIGRKRSEIGGNSAGASTLLSQVKSLFSGFNAVKQSPDGYDDGVVGEKETVMSLEIEDSELVSLSSQWMADYEQYVKKINDRQKNNYNYWKGDQYANKANDNRGTDNIIFEAIETLLPIISRQAPEPTVTAENTQDGQFVASMVSDILVRKADETRLKSKIKTVCRQWSIYFLGCFKMGWSEELDDMYFQIISPDRLILDPKGQFDGAEFMGNYIGEAKTATADELAKTFPNFKDQIVASVQGKMGTSLAYHEWWTNEYVFWRFRDIILDKQPNPYWNGEAETKEMDAYGVETAKASPGVNHFAAPKKPYSFLSVFNTGKQPHDETSLIEQVISLQDIVNKRLKQIDKNADDTNNGWVFSNQFTSDKAKEALNALKNGGAIISATEQISDSVQRFPAPQLASFVYQDMQDKREQVYNIMGVRGSTAQGVISEKTVRGKLEIKGQDVDRLALIIEQVEQLIDHLYNLAVQTMYVYYTPEQAARVLGQEDAVRFMQLLKNGPSRRLLVSVKEGSTIPQDSLTKRNEAIDLWNSKALDPETLFERLNFPDPQDSAAKLLTYQLNPQGSLQALTGATEAVMPTGQPPIPEDMAQPPQPIVPPNIPLNFNQ